MILYSYAAGFLLQEFKPYDLIALYKFRNVPELIRFFRVEKI